MNLINRVITFQSIRGIPYINLNNNTLPYSYGYCIHFEMRIQVDAMNRT